MHLVQVLGSKVPGTCSLKITNIRKRPFLPMASTTPSDDVLRCGCCHYPSHHHSHDTKHPMLMKVTTLLRPLINLLGKHFVLCVSTCFVDKTATIGFLTFFRSIFAGFYRLSLTTLCNWQQYGVTMLVCLTDFHCFYPLLLLLSLSAAFKVLWGSWRRRQRCVAGCHPQQSVPTSLHRCDASNQQGAVH